MSRVSPGAPGNFSTGGGGGGGDATAANQVTGNAFLESIDDKTPILGQQLAADSQPVVLTAAQLSTLTPPAAIVGFATSAKQDTQQTALDAIKTAVETIDNVVAGNEAQVDVVAALPTGTNSIGQVTANAGTNLNTSALLTTAAHDAAFGTAGSADAQVRTIQGVTSMTPVQVSQATASNLNMTEASAASILTSVQLIDDAIFIDDTSTHATGTTKGIGIMATATPTDTAVSANDIGMLAMTLNRELMVSLTTAIPAGNNNIGDVDIASSVLPTGAATLAEQQTQTASLSVLDDWDETDRAKVNLIVGQAGIAAGTGTDGVTVPRVTLATNVALPTGTNSIGQVTANAGTNLNTSALLTTTAHDAAFGSAGTADAQVRSIQGIASMTPVQVSQATAASLNMTEASAASALTALQLIDDTVYTDDTSTHATGTSKGLLMMAAATPTDTAVNANDIGAVGMTVNRELFVSLTTALPAGTNGIGKLTANAGVTIGAVEIAAAQTLSTVTTVTTLTGTTTLTPGTGATNLGKAEDAGHTSADVGVYTLGVRVDTPNVALTNTDADYSSFGTNKLGSIRTAALEDDLATAATKHVKKYYTNAGAVTDGIIWSPAAGARWFATMIAINVSAAATVTLEDDLAGGDVVVYKAELAANSGVILPLGDVPMFSGEDAADLMVTTSAGNVYITVVGYEI